MIAEEKWGLHGFEWVAKCEGRKASWPARRAWGVGPPAPEGLLGNVLRPSVGLKAAVRGNGGGWGAAVDGGRGVASGHHSLKPGIPQRPYPLETVKRPLPKSPASLASALIPPVNTATHHAASTRRQCQVRINSIPVRLALHDRQPQLGDLAARSDACELAANASASPPPPALASPSLCVT